MNAPEFAMVAAPEPQQLQQQPSGLTPVVSLEQVIERKKQLDTYIQKGLTPNKDYGVIPGTGSKPSLLKPGAEQILAWFNCFPTFETVNETHDYDIKIEYELDEKVWKNGEKHKTGRKTPATSTGRHSFSLRCFLRSRLTGEVVGCGVGACSTMESKYISRPNDSENTVLKMAKKRSLVDAVLTTFALSDRFTQDVEDMEHDEKETPPSQPVMPANAKMRLEKDEPVTELAPGAVNAGPAPSGEPDMRRKISDKIIDLVGASANDIIDMIEISTEWRDESGRVKKHGVRDLDHINYSIREGKKVSQAQMVYGKLKDLTPEQAKRELAAWRANRSEFER